jgi:hypothetical protein
MGRGPAHQTVPIDTVLQFLVGFSIASVLPANTPGTLIFGLLFAAGFSRVLPGRGRILINPAAPAAFVRAFLAVISAEYASKRFGILKSLIDDGRRVRVCQNVILEPAIVSQNVVDDAAEKGDIRSSANADVQVGGCTGATEARVDVDDCRATLARFHRPAETNRVSFGHIRTHDQDAITVRQILLVVCRSSAPEGGAQTGHRCGVSNPGLIFDMDDAEPRAKQLLDEIIFLVVERRAAE